MGGKDNVEADRRTGDAVAEVYPEIVTMAVRSRPFLVPYLEDRDAVRSIVAQVMNAVPSGSSLTLWNGTDTSEAVIAVGLRP